MSASSAQRPEQRLLNRRLFLCERTSFRAPKVLDAFQNIRISEKTQSSNVCTRCAHAPAPPRPIPTAGIRFSFIKTKCYCAQWTVQLLNCPAQIIVDRCICHCVHCTAPPPSYFWLFGIRIEVCTLLRNDFAAVIQKGSFLTLLSVEVKVRAFSFHSSFRKQPRYVMILLRLLSGLKNLSIL